MGRVAAVTYEQVAAAAEQSQAEGLTPTAKLIRSRLGDTGSLGTLQKHIVQWRSGQAGVQPATRILPPEVQRAVFKFVDEEVSRINGELAQQVAQAARDVVDLAADNDAQSNLVRELRAELAEQATLSAQQGGQLARMLDELKAARAETAIERREAELARLELTKLQSRLEVQTTLEGELRQLRTDFEEQRHACVRAEQSAAVLKAQKENLEARLAELKETAPHQTHSDNGEGDGCDDITPVHSPQPAARRTRKAKGGVPRVQDLEPVGTPSAREPGDPRQATLC